MTNTYTTQDMIKDIQELRGKKVSIFGQPTQLDNEVNELLVDIVEIIEKYEGCESDLSIDQLDEFHEMGILKEFQTGNSYNWAGNVSNDFNYYIYENVETGKILVDFKVHRYGDIRGNYTNSVVLEFDDEYEFLDILSSEGRKTVHLNINDTEYMAEVSATHDMIEIYNDEGDYITELYACDIEELETELKNFLS